MNSDLDKLISLQQVDAQIAAVKTEITELPRRMAAIEAQLAGAKAKVEAAQTALKNDEAARKRYEGDIQDQQQKISKHRDTSLKVKTNDEYRALMKEIEYAEAEISKLEDKILEIMVDSDARKSALKQAEAELKADTVEIEKEKAAARERTAAEEKHLAELTAQRNALRDGIEEDLLRQYERILKRRGSALAPVSENQMCSACRVILRPQVFQDVLNGEQIVYCDSCQRILYYVPPPPKEEEAEENHGKRSKSAKRNSPAADTTEGEAAAQ